MAPDKDKGRTMPVRPLIPKLAASTPNPKVAPGPKLASHFLQLETPSPTTPSSIATKELSRPRLFHNKSTPVKTFLSDNVTPRSSSRKSRASTHVTPIGRQDGTPTSMRPMSMYGGATDSSQLTTAPAVRECLDRAKTRPNSMFNDTVIFEHRTLSSSQKSAGPESNTPFFHSNEAHYQTPPVRPELQKKSSSFIYANGDQEQTFPAEERFLVPALSTNESGQISYTNVSSPSDTREIHKASSNATSKPSDKSPAASWQSLPSTFFRAASPPKDSIHLSYRKGASQIIRPVPPSGLSLTTDSTLQMNSRQSSLDSLPDRDDVPAKAQGAISILSSSVLGPPCSDATGSNEIKSSSIGDHVSPLVSPKVATQALSAVSTSGFQSPGGSQHTKVSECSETSQRSDLAANARRERKILDLEISNSSLLAINRSLEKEVRRQKAEIRQWKRMSRAPNRTSWLSDGTSNTSISRFSTLGNDLDELLTSPDEEDADLDDVLSGLNSPQENGVSPDALARQSWRYKTSENHRLKLDLLRHRELLVDNQKLDQSLKRCLGITEQLISGGSKAVEYRVRLDDVPIGGRVLNPEELEPHTLLQKRPADLEEAESYFQNWKESQTSVDHPFAESDLIMTIPERSETWAPRLPSTSHAEIMGEMF